LDTSTIVIAHAVLCERSIRGAARLLKKPVSSVAAAVSRLESEISVRLIQKAGTDLVLTLEAERLLPTIGQLASRIEEMMTIGPNSALDASLSLTALNRFAHVATTGSIRKTAQSLGLGQPQLTRQIAQIEVAFGCRLLERSVGGSATTVEGSRLTQAIGGVETLWAELAFASAGRFRRSAATIRLGSIIPLGYESHVATLLASLVADWLKDRPRQPLFVSSTTAEELIRGLKGGVFDAALLDTVTVPEDFDSHLVVKAPLALIGTREALAVGEESGGLAGLFRSTPIAVPSPRSGLRQMVNRYLSKVLSEAELEKLTLIEVDSIPVILNLVLHHGFVSVLPAASVTNIRGDLAQVPLASIYDLPLWLVWPRREDNRQTAAAVLSMLDSLGYRAPREVSAS
jgi:DNA-binding transcriptional LysR family regulator